MNDAVSAEMIKQARQEHEIARNVAEYLQTLYPDHQWAVNADLHGGVVHVYNLNLSGRWGFLMKVKDVIEDGWRRKIMQAGGEVLERYRLSRSRLKQNEYEALRLDSFGNPIADK